MTRVLIGMNAFKGSISTRLATDTVAAAFAQEGFEVEKIYLADGGDGTAEATVALGGRCEYVATVDPLMRPIEAPVVWLGNTAVVEMARASGLARLALEERNPMVATTWGTGLLVKHALEHGAATVLLGVGGSATVDGGLGMLAALGFSITDEVGNAAWRGGEGLSRVAHIVPSAGARRARLIVASDVTSPLIGPLGAAAVFGPQKGATPEMVITLEKGLERFADLTATATGVRLHDMPGTGAAGGVGGAALAWLGGHLEAGAELFMSMGGFDSKAPGCVALVTGEGSIDAQTLSGKAPLRVARRFHKVNPRGIVLALAGTVRDRALLHQAGLDVLASILDGPMSEREAMENGEALLRQAAGELARFLALTIP